jgi:hypothetical protein
MPTLKTSPVKAVPLRCPDCNYLKFKLFSLEDDTTRLACIRCGRHCIINISIPFSVEPKDKDASQ